MPELRCLNEIVLMKSSVDFLMRRQAERPASGFSFSALAAKPFLTLKKKYRRSFFSLFIVADAVSLGLTAEQQIKLKVFLQSLFKQWSGVIL